MGNEACKDCHKTEFLAHKDTNHAHTLHFLDRDELGKNFPPTRKCAGTDIVPTEKNKELILTLADQPGDSLPIDLAFDSEKTGMANVALLGAQTVELHKSYFPKFNKWYISPGRETQKADDVGMIHTSEVTWECILCHASTLAESNPKPERRFFGVGCESCHGAGGAHVLAMKGESSKTKTDGNALGKMESLGKVDATSLNNLCGKCHREVQSVNLSTQQATMTNRFQAYGLMKSRCYLKSGKSLSCLNCHDPHVNSSKNLASYEKACLNCHSSQKAQPNLPREFLFKTCPVNTTRGGIPCHMPKRAVFPKSIVPTFTADHYQDC